MDKLFTMDGEKLMTTPLPPLNYVAEGLVPQGLHILAGAPKIGKSWLALMICLRVAKGEKIWCFQTTRGTVLYLCLEDSFTRIQNRLFDITEDAPDTLHFATMSAVIGEGLENQIEDFLKEHPDTVLIVIDTLQRIRKTSADANPYASDYRDINILKALADKYRIAILLIHHLRKMNDDDPMNMISGTTGISGATDSNFVLKKDKRSGNSAMLYCVGRDIEYRELQLEFDKVTHIWELHADSSEEPEQFLDNTIVTLSAVMKAIRQFSGTPSELLSLLSAHGLERVTVNVLSKKLIQRKHELDQLGISYATHRSNGKRFVELECRAVSDDSADRNDISTNTDFADPVDPVGTVIEFAGIGGAERERQNAVGTQG